MSKKVLKNDFLWKNEFDIPGNFYIVYHWSRRKSIGRE
jgi:hypothetical protein